MTGIPTTHITDPHPDGKASSIDFTPTREADKSRVQKAEDYAYTINHALACTATDLIDPYVGKVTQKYLSRRISVGCGDDHGSGSHTHNWVGEVVGDFGAVPLTIGIQRFAPWIMDAVRYVAEPVMGDMFRHGAKKAAQASMLKAMDAGQPYNIEDFRTHAHAIYRYEMQHLPQGLMWTASSIGLNIATQKMIGSTAKPSHIFAGKLAGSSLSTGLLFGIRGFSPDSAHRWDKWATTNVLLPTTRAVGKLFGVRAKDVETMAEKKEAMENKHWTGRVLREAEATETATAASR
jgi:hypothetical protein